MRCETCGVELAFDRGLCLACLADLVELDAFQPAATWSPRYQGTGARVEKKNLTVHENLRSEES